MCEGCGYPAITDTVIVSGFRVDLCRLCERSAFARLIRNWRWEMRSAA